MKKAPIFVGVALGAIVGLFSAIPDDVGLKTVMMSIGALVGAAVGGAIARIGKKDRPLKSDDDTLVGLGVTPDDLMRNYWRDKDRPPLTSPLKPEDGRHQFDSDYF